MKEEIAELKRKLEKHEARILALEKAIEKKPETSRVEKKGTEAMLLTMKDTGFFNEERTISQIKDALHARGKIAKVTDLSPYLLKLVRNDVLKREKREINSKKMWTYFA